LDFDTLLNVLEPRKLLVAVVNLALGVNPFLTAVTRDPLLTVNVRINTGVYVDLLTKVTILAVLVGSPARLA